MTLQISPPLKKLDVIGSPVTALPFKAQVSLMLEWASGHESKIVCLANAHMLVEAHWTPKFASVLDQADLVAPDGMPLVWMLKLLGAYDQNRVAGMDVFLALCQSASEQNISVFFLGSHRSILDRIRVKLEQDFPDLHVVGIDPLPFRPSTPAEDEAIIQSINQSGAGLVFISLGCPKQEVWMAQHKGKIQGVTIGVGGIFPIYAGIHQRAPAWMRELGLEWAYRLLQEPRRLWSRYERTNRIFIGLALQQILTSVLPKYFRNHLWTQ